MIFSKTFCALATSLFTLTLNSFVWATPIVFEFTGTITDTVIDKTFGNETKLMSRTEWIGQQISGTISLDLDDQWKYFGDDDPYTIFKSYDTRATGAEWMQVKLRNPDGTYFDSSLATDGRSIPFDPYPNSAYAQIVHLMDDAYYGVPLSNVDFSRWYHNDNSPLMYNHFELGLIGNGDNASSLVSSKNFDDIIVKPDFANLQNYGLVRQSHRTLADPSYYFLIDSFSRIETEVPEPPAPLLLFSALLVLMVKRFKIFRQK